MKKAAAVCLLLAIVSCSHVHFDLGVSAADGNDLTVALSGCDQGVEKGFLFCRARDGASSEGVVKLVFPVVDCPRGSCIEYQFIRKDGSFGLSGGLPKGQSQADIRLKDIVSAAGSIEPSHEGVYMVLTKIYYTAPDGFEYSFVSRAIVYLLVNSKTYIPAGCNSPVMSWSRVVEPRCTVQWSTAGRAALCGCGDVE